MDDNRRRWSVVRLWAPVLAYMAVIFATSATPIAPETAGLLPDKPVHALIYAGLALVLVRALGGGLRQPISCRVAVAAIALSGLYGISDEVHQAFVPTRHPDVADLVADLAGATAAVTVLGARTHRSSGRRSRETPEDRRV